MPSTAEDRIDRHSEVPAAQRQRIFAERLDAAIATEVQQLRERRQTDVADLEAWAASERERVTREVAAEEQRFAEWLQGPARRAPP